MKLLSSIFDRLLPPVCGCCAQVLKQPSNTALCEYCYFALPWLGHACSVCALPLIDSISTVCGQCLQKPPAFFTAKIPFRYDYPLDKIILDFKFQQQFSKCKTLSQLMLDYLQDTYKDQPLPDALIPAPMYWKRQFLRGFNQSEQLALSLGKALCLPVLNRVCYRRHHNKPQKDSDKQSRQNNLRNAFAIQSRNLHLIENKHLAVVDDVVTTSATVREISKLLIKSGAASVVIWALARTPRPGSL